MLILLSLCSLTALGAIPDLAPCLVVILWILWGYTGPQNPRTNHRTQPDKTQDTISHSLQLDRHRSPDNGACSIILCCPNTRGFLSHKFLFDCQVQHKYVLFWSDLTGGGKRGGGGGGEMIRHKTVIYFYFRTIKGDWSMWLMKKIPYKREIQYNLHPPPTPNLSKTYVQFSCLGIIAYSHVLPATRIYSSSLYPFISLYLTLSSQFFPMIMLYK